MAIFKILDHYAFAFDVDYVELMLIYRPTHCFKNGLCFFFIFNKTRFKSISNVNLPWQTLK